GSLQSERRKDEAPATAASIPVSAAPPPAACPAGTPDGVRKPLERCPPFVGPLMRSHGSRPADSRVFGNRQTSDTALVSSEFMHCCDMDHASRVGALRNSGGAV